MLRNVNQNRLNEGGSQRQWLKWKECTEIGHSASGNMKKATFTGGKSMSKHTAEGRASACQRRERRSLSWQEKQQSTEVHQDYKRPKQGHQGSNTRDSVAISQNYTAADHASRGDNGCVNPKAIFLLRFLVSFLTMWPSSKDSILELA